MTIIPITEEDKQSIEQMMIKLVRFRKREHAYGRTYTGELDDAIKALQQFGATKGWWDHSILYKLEKQTQPIELVLYKSKL